MYVLWIFFWKKNQAVLCIVILCLFILHACTMKYLLFFLTLLDLWPLFTCTCLAARGLWPDPGLGCSRGPLPRLWRRREQLWGHRGGVQWLLVRRRYWALSFELEWFASTCATRTSRKSHRALRFQRLFCFRSTGSWKNILGVKIQSLQGVSALLLTEVQFL